MCYSCSWNKLIIILLTCIIINSIKICSFNTIINCQTKHYYYNLFFYEMAKMFVYIFFVDIYCTYTLQYSPLQLLSVDKALLTISRLPLYFHYFIQCAPTQFFWLSFFVLLFTITKLVLFSFSIHFKRSLCLRHTFSYCTMYAITYNIL